MRNFYKKIALLFTTMALFTLVATSQTTVTYLVVDGGDDVEEYRGVWSTYADGYMDITSTDLELCTQNANNKQGVGVIFRGVAVPKSATIASAFLQFTCDDDDNQEGRFLLTFMDLKKLTQLLHSLTYLLTSPAARKQQQK